MNSRAAGQPRTGKIGNDFARHSTLQAAGTPIGTNDLWMAATALAHRMRVVTKNVDEFRRVPGLAVLGF